MIINNSTDFLLTWKLLNLKFQLKIYFPFFFDPTIDYVCITRLGIKVWK